MSFCGECETSVAVVLCCGRDNVAVIAACTRCPPLLRPLTFSTSLTFLSPQTLSSAFIPLHPRLTDFNSEAPNFTPVSYSHDSYKTLPHRPSNAFTQLSLIHSTFHFCPRVVSFIVALSFHAFLPLCFSFRSLFSDTSARHLLFVRCKRTTHTRGHSKHQPAWNDGTTVPIRVLKAMCAFHNLWTQSSQMTRGWGVNFGKVEAVEWLLGSLIVG